MKILLGSLLLILGSSLNAVAQPIEYDRYLLPVYSPFPVEGAGGSSWEIQTLITNGGSTPVLIRDMQSTTCNITTCSDIPIPAGVSVPLIWRTFNPRTNPGRFVEIEKGKRGVSLQLRVRDTSVGTVNWGAEVPVVAESAVPVGQVSHLTGIALTNGYRQLLRVYDLASTRSGVRVRVYDVNPLRRNTWMVEQPDALLGTFVLPLTLIGNYPTYAQFSEFSQFEAQSAHGVVRLEIEPLNPSMRIWAMVTLTNNVTHQFTTITPQGPAAD